MLAGTDNIESSKVELEEITIPSGQYMILEGKGEMPQAVIETSGKIWEYFTDEDSKEKRAYTTDFEHYKNQDEVAIHIAIL